MLKTDLRSLLVAALAVAFAALVWVLGTAPDEIADGRGERSSTEAPAGVVRTERDGAESSTKTEDEVPGDAVAEPEPENDEGVLVRVVWNDTGAPVEGASVGLAVVSTAGSVREPDVWRRTGRDGTAQFEGAPPDRSWVVAGRRVPVQVATVVSDESDSRLELRVERGFEIRGRVALRSGAPASGIRVSVRESGERAASGDPPTGGRRVRPGPGPVVARKRRSPSIARLPWGSERMRRVGSRS